MRKDKIKYVKDIENRADIDDLLTAFYRRALIDEEIGYIFTDVAMLDLTTHLPIIGDFWDSMLFGSKKYQEHERNPMLIHAELHEKTPLDFRHFRRWLDIFEKTVDEMFVGERADLIKMRANSIGNRMLNFISGVPAIKRTKDR